MLAERTDREVEVHHALTVAAELFFAFLGQNRPLDFSDGRLAFENGALGKISHQEHPFALCKMADGVR